MEGIVPWLWVFVKQWIIHKEIHFQFILSISKQYPEMLSNPQIKSEGIKYLQLDKLEQNYNSVSRLGFA